MFIRVHFHCGAHSAAATVAHVEWLYDLANTHTHTLSLPHTHTHVVLQLQRDRPELGLASMLCVPSLGLALALGFIYVDQIMLVSLAQAPVNRGTIVCSAQPHTYTHTHVCSRLQLFFRLNNFQKLRCG